MPVVKQYHYANISQRRYIEANSLVTAFIVGWVSMESVLSLSRFFPYSRIFEILIGVFLVSHLIGNLFGKLLFCRVRTSRIPYILTELAFIGVCAFLAIKTIPAKSGTLLLDAFFTSPLLLAAALASVPFLAGIKNSYFLKVSLSSIFVFAD